jgi:hypothetical protein
LKSSGFGDTVRSSRLPIDIDGKPPLTATVCAFADQYISPRLLAVLALVFHFCYAGRTVEEEGIAALADGVFHGWRQADEHLVRNRSEIREHLPRKDLR